MREHGTVTLPLMLFAAGFGTRMGMLTADRPKPLIEVAGRPLIDHALDMVTEAGVTKTVVNLHYRAELLETHLAQRPVTTLCETPNILDTGGGLRNALPLLGKNPVFTLNSDAVWHGPNPLTLLAQAWDPNKMDALLLCIPVARARGHYGKGDFIFDQTGRISRGKELTYSGAQIMKTDRLRDVAETAFSLNVIWNAMQADGRLFGLKYLGTWCDVGHPGGIALAEEMLASV
ncbi:MAG: nucleotidyltransferase family protein [Pseudomonadota bacterium]